MKKIVSIFTVIILCFVVLSNVYAEEYEEYKSGDLVRYNDIAFYVLFDSSSEEDSMQLLKMVPLTHEEINKYTDNKAYLYVLYNRTNDYRKSEEKFAYGNMSYYYDNNCCYESYDSSNSYFYEKYGSCKNDYELSNVKKVVDLWTEENFNNEDIIPFEDGYKSRLLKGNELVDFDPRNDGSSSLYYISNGPNWLTKPNYYSWVISDNNSNSSYVYTISTDYHYLKSSAPYEKGSVRPTIKLKKSSISKVSFNEYHNNAVREYKIGDIINYNDSRFYVIKNSSESDSTVTLLKDNPLTRYELEKYGVGYINNYIYEYNGKSLNPGTVISDNEFYNVAYLSTDKCYYNGSNGTRDYSGCNQNYDVSNVKHIVDNWLLDNVSVDDIALDEFNYNARLINYDDLVELGYISIQANTSGRESFKAGNDTPKFMLDNGNYKGMLTMAQSYIYTGNGYNDYGIAIGDDGYRFIARDIPNGAIGTVRPVVTLNKKEIAPKITNVEEIEDTVSGDDQSTNIEVDIETEVDNSNVKEYAAKEVTNVISVPNTLSSKNMLLIIIGVIISGVGIITFIYFKKK